MIEPTSRWRSRDSISSNNLIRQSMSPDQMALQSVSGWRRPVVHHLQTGRSVLRGQGVKVLNNGAAFMLEQDCQKDAGGNAIPKPNRCVWTFKKQLIEARKLQLKPAFDTSAVCQNKSRDQSQS